MQAQGSLTIERMCGLGRVSRAGFYRYWQQQAPREEETELRGQIQQIVLTHRGNYGYRRVGAALRHQGVVVNSKKLRRLMKEHDLQPKRRRRYVVTTDSNHASPIFKPDKGLGSW